MNLTIVDFVVSIVGCSLEIDHVTHRTVTIEHQLFELECATL